MLSSAQQAAPMGTPQSLCTLRFGRVDLEYASGLTKGSVQLIIEKTTRAAAENPVCHACVPERYDGLLLEDVLMFAMAARVHELSKMNPGCLAVLAYADPAQCPMPGASPSAPLAYSVLPLLMAGQGNPFIFVTESETDRRPLKTADDEAFFKVGSLALWYNPGTEPVAPDAYWYANSPAGLFLSFRQVYGDALARLARVHPQGLPELPAFTKPAVESVVLSPSEKRLVDLLRKQTGIYRNVVTIRTNPGGIDSVEYILRKPFNKTIFSEAAGDPEIAGIETVYTKGKPEAVLIRRNLKG